MTKQGWICSLLSCLPMLSFAGAMGETKTNNHFVSTLSVGPVWQSQGKTQTLFLTPEIEKTYKAHQANQLLAEGELFLGIQRLLPYNLQGQIGFAAATTSNAHLTGKIWDDGDPTFDNYIYGYDVRHTHVAVEGKLFFDKGYFVTPWINGSVGVGFNQAHHYNNIPTIFEAVKNPNFSSKTKTTFTYTVGAGLQRPLCENWQVGVGYEFADWGQSRLGRVAGQTLGKGGLKLNHLYTNGFLLSISYLT